MLLSEGQTFAGYTIRRKLGAGGMGSVYLAAHPRLPRLDAVKVLSAELTSDPEYGPRFLREADLVSTLSHPNILGVHDRGDYDGQLWISMDYVAGTDAAKLLREQYPGGMPAAVALPIITAVASALDHAHQRGLLHRDVKPANILLDSETSRVYLADFGIARPMNDTAGLTATNAAVGTVAYAAPEQLRGDPMDGRTDQYALACTAFQLLTGTTPYADSNPAVVITRHVTAPVPSLGDRHPELRELDPVLARAMAKTPAGRFGSCMEFAHALQQQADQQLTAARTHSGNTPTATAIKPPLQQVFSPQIAPPPPMAPPPAPRKARRVLVLAAVGVLLIAAGTFAGVRLLSRSSSTSARPNATQAVGTAFAGLYRADYSQATDLDGTALPGVPPMTGSWNVRSSCSSNGCVANASYANNDGTVVASNLTFDQLAGDWIAVATGSVQCTNGPTEAWVVFTLTPKPDGTLTGETIRATADGCSSGKMAVTFTRTGDGQPNAVPDPSDLPPRTVSMASALRGRYHANIVYANGSWPPGTPDAAVRTYCLRTGDRCISAFHGPDGVETLVFANGKWTRNEQSTVPCARGGTTHATITAEYPMPEPLQNPIPVLEGHGVNASTGGQCQGGEFTEKFVRTSD